MSKDEWSGDRPVEDGWYWVREPGDADVISLVIDGTAHLGDQTYDVRLGFCEGTKWYGPLTPPK